MGASTEVQRAREILDEDVIGGEEIERVFGRAPALGSALAATVPFPVVRLERAKAEGELLILRCADAGGEPLTLRRLIARFAPAFDAKYLQGMGYQLKSEWGIELEPLAAEETCAAGWALVRKEPLLQTCNLSYEEQEEVLRTLAAGEPMRRRRATEIAFDLVAYHAARGQRLLYDRWDWSSSRTADGGYLNVGHFDDRGMQVFSFSPGVRHGKLGLCPNLQSAIRNPSRSPCTS
jgi:hypothetical protein